MPVSPGVYTREFDFSDYTAQASLTNPCFVGAATKGPVGLPTRITSEGQFVSTFGRPVATVGVPLAENGPYAVIQYLKTGGTALYLRVANAACTAAAASLPGYTGGSNGTAPSGTVALGTTAGGTQPTNHDTVSLLFASTTYNFEFLSSGSSVSGVGSVGTLTGGTLYTSGTYTNVALTVVSGSAGTGATANITVAGGAVTSVTIVAPGANYSTTSVLSCLAAGIGGTGTGFQFTVASVANTGVLIGGNAASTLANLSAVLAQNVANVTVANTTAALAPTLTVTSTLVGSITFTLSRTGTAAVVANTAGSAASLGTATATGLTVNAAYNYTGVAYTNPGSWANGMQIAVTSPSASINALPNTVDIAVFVPDTAGNLQLVEQYNRLSLDSTQQNYIVTALTTGVPGVYSASSYINVTITTAPTSLLSGTYTLSGGADAISSLTDADYIGTVSGQTSTGLQALTNQEQVIFNVLSIPGKGTAGQTVAVINAALALAAARGDFLFLVDPPFGLSVAGVVNWHNGTSGLSNAPTLPIDSNYAALYWPWKQVTDAYSGTSIWLPPSTAVLPAMALSDKAAGPWFPVAGVTRGKVQANKIEYSPTQNDRDLLIGQNTTNRVNPLVNFAQSGLTIWGNKTLQRKTTALGSIHIRRMMLYVEAVIAAAARSIVFNPNDQVTWVELSALCNSTLKAVKAQRGMTDFHVICDSTTNTPDLVAQNTCRVRVLIKPTPAAEIILLDYNVVAQGVTLASNQ